MTASTTRPLDAATRQALDAARHLAEHGVPIFLAEPALDDGGRWVPDGGHNGCGYWLPADWQRTVADPAVVDRWRPGKALAAVMGHAVDGVDVDPRHGGHETADELRAAGCWPRSYGRQHTPSGGWHDLVAPLRVRSRDGVLPGIDVKAGHDGHGYGFLFLAPTTKLSKATGEIAAYTWTVPPDLDELDPLDDTGGTLAARIEAMRAADDAEAPDVPHDAYDAMTAPQRGRVDRYLTGVVRGTGDELAEAARWPEGYRDARKRGWQKVLADACNRFGRLARADWTPWTYDDAHAALTAVVPRVMAAAVDLDATWRAQRDRRSPAPYPPSLAEDWTALLPAATPAPAVEATVAENGAQEPAQAPQGADDGPTSLHEHEARRLILTPASAIKPRRVLWAWAGRLALGTLALLAGREGLGKSTLAYWIAARLSRGELPGEYHGTPKSVLVCATEDSWEHTIVPRLIAAGADLDRVFRVEVRSADEIVLGLSLPRDLHRVEQAAAETDAALLLLDPLMSRLADDLDTHRDGDVRRALEPLVAVADRTAMTVLGLIHHNKSGSADPLQLVMGSKAFTAVARSVHTVVPDPDDDTEQRRLFGTPKNNLGRTDLPMLAFTVTGHPVETDDGIAWTSRLEWGEEIADTIGETMRRAQDATSDRSATQEAADWLTDYIQMHGGSAASADVKRDGAKAGHSVDALKRARRKLRLTTRSEGFPRVTHWEFPVGAQLEQQLEQAPRGDALTAPTAPTEPSQRSQRSWSSGRTPGEPAAPTGEDVPPEADPVCPCGRPLWSQASRERGLCGRCIDEGKAS